MTGFTSKRQATADKLDDDDAQGYIAQFEEALQKEYRRGYDAGKASQQEQEPVAWRLSNEAFDYQITSYDKEQANTYIKNGWHLIDVLYTSPPKRPWVGLTAGEIYKSAQKSGVLMRGVTSDDALDLAQAIEAKLKEKNT